MSNFVRTRKPAQLRFAPQIEALEDRMLMAADTLAMVAKPELASSKVMSVTADQIAQETHEAVFLIVIEVDAQGMTDAAAGKEAWFWGLGGQPNAAAAEEKMPPLSVVVGMKWADTPVGERWNGLGHGAIILGHGIDWIMPGGGFTGGGKGFTSELNEYGGQTGIGQDPKTGNWRIFKWGPGDPQNGAVLREYTEKDYFTGNETTLRWDANGKQLPPTQKPGETSPPSKGTTGSPSILDQIETAVENAVNGFINWVRSHDIFTNPDDMGGGGWVPSPVKGAMQMPLKWVGGADGPGDGRGVEILYAGISLYDGIAILVETGGDDGERDLETGYAISHEAAMRENFHSDPPRSYAGAVTTAQAAMK